MTFDFTSEDAIPWGESILPPMPRLLLLSDEGILCIFNVINLNTSAPQLCGPAKEHLPDAIFTSNPASTTTLPAPVQPIM